MDAMSLMNYLAEIAVSESAISDLNKGKIWRKINRHPGKMQTPFEKLLDRDGWKEIPKSTMIRDFFITLDEGKLEKGFLHFASKNPFSHDGSKIVARTCYFKLWELINNPSASENTLITGGPSLGKAFFLYFVMWKLSLEGKSFVYSKHGTNEFYLLHEGKAYMKLRCLSSCGVLSRKEMWFLVDNHRPLPCSARTLMVSSLGREAFKAFERRDPIVKYYMPVWTFEEGLFLYETLHAQNLSKSEFEERFSLCGGVPRHLFDDFNETQRNINRALCHVNMSHMKKCLTLLLGDSNESLHKLFLLNVCTEDKEVSVKESWVLARLKRRAKAFKFLTVSFCSEKVGNMVFEALYRQDRLELVETLKVESNSIHSSIGNFPLGFLNEKLSAIQTAGRQ